MRAPCRVDGIYAVGRPWERTDDDDGKARRVRSEVLAREGGKLPVPLSPTFEESRKAAIQASLNTVANGVLWM